MILMTSRMLLKPHKTPKQITQKAPNPRRPKITSKPSLSTVHSITYFVHYKATTSKFCLKVIYNGSQLMWSLIMLSFGLCDQSDQLLLKSNYFVKQILLLVNVISLILYQSNHIKRLPINNTLPTQTKLIWQLDFGHFKTPTTTSIILHSV